MSTVTEAYSELEVVVPSTTKESPADATAFLQHVKRQIRHLMLQRQKDPTFYLPCVKHSLNGDAARMIAAFVIFSHESIFRLCPQSHVWLEGEFWHSVYRIDGINSDPEQLFTLRHQRQRSADQILSSYDLLQDISLRIPPDRRIQVLVDQNVFTY